MLGAHASAQEMTFRSGVITGITPMQVEAAAGAPPAASRTAGAFGRALGRAAGRAASRVTGEYTYEAYDVASSTTSDLVGSMAATSGARTVTAYMVMLRFDEGGESAIRAANVDTLRIGARARVFGSGASAQIVAE
ncbi:hypothetical protein ACF3M1_03530 [Luteimonas sp. WGS1318]|uniref:hypothetical protein n=1 Tax=Luteimonas sp. WGS1318 TaxID=3366815 RepID=UPI00372D2562